MEFRLTRAFFLSVIIFFITCIQLAGQIKLTEPRIEVIEDKMIISYDILGNGPEDTINISLDITDSLGNKIIPGTLSGDIGRNTGNGTEKKIIWDLKVDSFYVNMNLYIGLVAEVINKKQDHVPAENKFIADTVNDLDAGKNHSLPEYGGTEPETKNTEVLTKTASRASFGKTIILSAIFPGWGLTKLSNNKPYWLIGVAGAGCIAGSVYFNRQSYSNYRSYIDSDDPETMNKYFDDAEKQKNISDYLVISAIAIWVADIGLSGIRASHLNRKNKSAKNNLILDYQYNKVTNSPVLSIIYKF